MVYHQIKYNINGGNFAKWDPPIDTSHFYSSFKRHVNHIFSTVSFSSFCRIFFHFQREIHREQNIKEKWERFKFSLYFLFFIDYYYLLLLLFIIIIIIIIIDENHELEFEFLTVCAIVYVGLLWIFLFSNSKFQIFCKGESLHL